MRRKHLIVSMFVVALVLLISFVSTWADDGESIQNVDGCNILNTTGATYVLTQDVSSTGTCFNITHPNITLDCNGYWINYSIGGSDNTSGVYSNQFNTTVKNCNIIDGNTISVYRRRYGIFFESSSSGTIFNNTVLTNNSGSILLYSGSNYNNISKNIFSSNFSQSIELERDSSYNIIENNTALSIEGISMTLYFDSMYNTLINNNATSRDETGIFIYVSDYNTLINNTGVGGQGEHGIYIVASDNNLFINNTAISNSIWGFGTHIRLSSNNIFVEHTSKGISPYGKSDEGQSIYLYYSHNNLFRDCINITGGMVDLYVNGSSNNIFLNCSYDLNKEEIDDSGEIIRKWYYQAYVNDTSGNPLDGVNISAYNATGQLQFSELTNSTGYFSRQEVIEYVNNGGTRSYYNNYTINASLIGQETLSKQLNITTTQNKLDDVFTLSGEGIQCGTLDQAGTTYVLTNNVSSNETCFNITHPNITLDCNGYWINYSIGGSDNTYGVYSNQFNTTVKNCNIVDGNWSTDLGSREGIHFDGNSNSTLLNNWVNTSSSNAISVCYGQSFINLTNNTGISLNNNGIYYSAQRGILENNFGISDSWHGLDLAWHSYNNILINNTGITNSSGIGIIVYYSENNTLINCTGIANSGYTSGIEVIGSSNITFYGVSSIGEGYHGIFIYGASSNILFRDCKDIFGDFYDLRIMEDSINNTFINCSYSLNKEHIVEGSELIRKWYYQAYVNDTDGNLFNNVNVSAYNSTGHLQFTQQTNNSGWIDRQEITEYINRGGGTSTYFSNYSINASLAGQETISKQLNLTLTKNKLDDVFTFESTGNLFPPNIIFQEPPTPFNGSTIYSSNQTIVANISDVSNTSSWIDFDRSLIGYWSMDYYNDTGIYDNSSYNNFGRFDGGLSPSDSVDGARGQGLGFFDNNAVLVNYNPVFNIDDTLTISAWIYINDLLNTEDIILARQFDGINLPYLFAVNPSGHLWLRTLPLETKTATSTRIISYETWVHVAVTFNKYSGETIFYINGESETPLYNIDELSNSITSTQRIELGHYYTHTLRGYLDEVMLFNRTLSETEISALYNSQSNLFNATFNNLSEGEHNYTVHAIDETGNYITSGERNFIINTEVVEQNECGILDEEGTIYVLTQNVSSTGTCFTVTSPNVTLDCNGYWINFSAGGLNETHGVYSDRFNTTVKNCNIFDGNLSSESRTRHAVLFYRGADNSSIINSNLITNNSRTINLDNSSHVNIMNNTISSNYIAIYLLSNCRNLNIENNNILTGVTGIFLYGGAHHSVLRNNYISTAGRGDRGISVYASDNVDIINNNITGEFNYSINLMASSNTTISNPFIDGASTGIELWGSNNTLIRDCIYLDGTGYVTRLYDGLELPSINATFLNCSYNENKEYLHLPQDSLIRKWYYQAYVNDTLGGSRYNVSVSAYNSTGHLQFSELTNSTGYIPRQEVIEYVNRGGTQTYFSNYSINASLIGQETISKQLNLTLTKNKLDDFFTFEEEETPGMNVCGVLGEAGKTYILMKNVSSPGTCFNITAENITLDCNGYWINYSIGGVNETYGIYSNQFNTTIRNCNIIDGNWGGNSSRYGIMFDTSDNGSISNSFVNVSNSRAVFLTADADFNNITNNSFNSFSGPGMAINSSDYNILINNTFNSLSSGGLIISTLSTHQTVINSTGISYSAFGVYLDYSSYNNLFNCTGISDSNVGIYLGSGSNYNNLIDIRAESANMNGFGIYFSNNTYIENLNSEGEIYGIFIRESSNTLIKNSLNISGKTYDVYYAPYTLNFNNTFLNCSYNTESVNGAGSELIRKWYYQAYVNDTLGGSLYDVNVSAYNSTGHLQFTTLTDLTGHTLKQEATEYVNRSGTSTYFSNYTINASLPNYETQSNVLNFTSTKNKLDDVFTFEGEETPGMNACGFLDETGKTYILTNNVSSTGTCFTVTSPNVTLDCNGYWINYSTNGNDNTHGVYSNQSNTTIKNCNVVDGNWTSDKTTRNGIYFDGADYGTILNNYVSVNNSQAIFLRDDADFNNIINNIAYSGYHAIDIQFSNNNFILNNLANSTGVLYGGSTAIIVYGTGVESGGGYNNTLINNTAISRYSGISISNGANHNFLLNNSARSSEDHGVFIWGSDNILISQESINLGGGLAIIITGGSKNNLIKDCRELITPYWRDVGFGWDLGSVNNSFINCSYKGEFVPGNNSELIRKWYYQAYVNDTLGNPLLNANVTAYNSTGHIQFTTLTNSSGYIPKQEVIAYINYGGYGSENILTYHDNYTINVTHIGYDDSVNETYNFSITLNKIDDFFTLSGEGMQCGTLDEANTVYTLTGNVSSPGTCFNITRPNITLDCNGHWINYSIGGENYTYGVYTNQFNTTVKNCNFVEGNGTNFTDVRAGIFTYNARNSTIFNNYMDLKDSFPLDIERTDNINITNNTLISETGHVIYTSNSKNSIIADNVLIVGDSIAIFLNSFGNNSILSNNNISTSKERGQRGMYIYFSDNVSIINNNITGRFNRGINLYASLNTIVLNPIIDGADIGIDLWGVNNSVIRDCIKMDAWRVIEVSDIRGSSVNNSLINCSYDSSRESIGEIRSYILRKWYYQAYVNDTDGNPFNNVNVSAYNSTGHLQFSELTNSTGYIPRQEVIEYIHRWGEITNYSNYTIGAYLEGHPPAKNHIINFTQTRNKVDDWFTIREPDSTPPSITINSPVGTIADVTPLINVSLSEEARVWYSVDGGENITLCEECDFSDDKFLYLNEGEHIFRVFANDSSGNFNFNIFSLFIVDMENNYYDDFEDNSSIYSSNNITWNKGNVTSKIKFDYLNDPSLVSVYLFNDSNNLGFDLKGNNSMNRVWGSPSISPIIPSEKTGYSINLSGNSEVCIPSGFTFNPSENHTMCFWVRKTSLNQGNAFAQRCVYDTWDDGNSAYVFTANNCVPPYVADTVYVGGVFSESTWVHICQKYDSNNYNMTFYVDGAERMSSVLAGPIALTSGSNNAWCIGGCDGSCYMQGQVFEPMWFDRQLNSNEIASIYSEEYYPPSGSFTSYPVNTTENIHSITNITWTEINTDENNNITVQVSVDGGENWYNTTSGNALPQIFTGNNTSLVYRVIFSTINSPEPLAISDINISWSNSPDIPGENSCGFLDEEGKTYVLTENVSSNETCFNITHPNIILDCNGHWINYTGTGLQNAYGLYTNQFNTTLKNCNIYNYTIGAYYHGASNGTIQNNTMQIYQNKNLSDVVYESSSTPMASGILLYNSADYNLIINTTSYSQYGRGIYLNRATNNTIINSNGSSDLNPGIQIYTNSWDSVVGYNNTILNSYAYSNSNIGLWIGYYGGWNEVINSTIVSNSSQSGDHNALAIEYSSYNKIINTTGYALYRTGIFVLEGHNILILNSTGISNSSSSGISLEYRTMNSVIANSTGISLGDYGGNCGIRISGIESYPCTNNTLTDSIGISMGEYGSGICIGGFNNTIKNNTATGQYGYDFRWDATDILVEDCVNTTGINYGVYSHENADVDVTFLNCSYNNELIQSVNSNLTRKWYYQAYVNDNSGNPLSDVNVSSRNSTNQLQFTQQTNNSGWIDRQEITEYVNRGGTRTYYNNYTINASLEGYKTENNILNFTITQNKIDDIFTLNELISGENACGFLDEEGKTYVLTENVSSNETCFTITQPNITLDCNGYWINYSIGGANHTYGVYSNQFNTTVRNCNIIDGNWNSNSENRVGIYLHENNNSNLYNNSVNVGNSDGITLQQSFNGIISNNSISSNHYGIYLYVFSENNYISNNIVFGGNTAIRLEYYSINNTLIKNIGNSTLNYGIYLLSQSSDNKLIENSVYGIRATSIESGSNNTLLIGHSSIGYFSVDMGYNVRDTLFKDCKNMEGAINLEMTVLNTTFLNCSYDINKEFIENGNELIRKWYYQAYVNDISGNPLSDVNVSSRNSTNQVQFTQQTNSSGWIDRQEVIEYINRDNTRTYYSNYTINASLEGYKTENNILNFTITENKIDDIFILNELISGENACGMLDEEGKTYVLTENVSSNETCFTITQPNITLDCNGYWINYSIGGANYTYGVYSNQFNTTVRNCNIIDGNWSSILNDRRGINLDSYSHNSTLFNTFVNTNVSTAIYSGSNYNNLSNISVISNTGYAIFLLSNSNNILSNISASSNTHHGIYLDSSSNNNLLNINTNSESNSGIHLYLSSNNTLSNISAISNMLSGIFIHLSSNNTLSNISASSNNFTGIHIHTSSNNILSNVSTNSRIYPAIYLYTSSNNNLSNILASSNTSTALYLYENSNSNLITNSTLISLDKSGTLAYLSLDCGDNIFYGNNFTDTSGYYVQDLNGSNYYNTTINGRGEGNIWYNVINGSVEITGNVSSTLHPSLYIGWRGSGYPYNSENSLGKIYGNVIDYAPLTNQFREDIPGENSCGVLNESGRTYILTENVSSQGTCFTVTRPNITLDCNGYWINYSIGGSENDNGINSYQDNVTIKNCNVIDGNESVDSWTRVGIMIGGNNGTVYNNYVYTNNSIGIYLWRGSNFTFENNRVNKSSGAAMYLWYGNNVIYRNNSALGGTGITIRESNNTILVDNTGKGNGPYSEHSGIFILDQSSNTTIINCTGFSERAYGIFLHNVTNTTLINSTAISNNSLAVRISLSSESVFINQVTLSYNDHGLFIDDSNNTLFRDSVINGSEHDVYIIPYSLNNTFINCSYDREFVSSENSDLTRKWYYQAYVNDTDGNFLNNVNVSAYNSTGHLQFSELTNSSGWIPKQEVTAYVNIGGIRTYYRNYTIGAYLEGRPPAKNHIIDFWETENKIDDWFTIREPDFTPPSITIFSPIGTIADVTPLINVSLSEEAHMWYNLDNGENITLCEECNFSDDKFLYSSEGEHIFRVFANDSSGNFNTTSVSFAIDMNNNYYDGFEDNSSILSINNAVWNNRNVSFRGELSYLSDPNLVSAYLFNDSINLGLDLKGNNNMEEVVGSPSRSTIVPPGKIGYSINIPHESEICIASGFTFNPSQNHTMCFWARKTNLTYNGNVFSQNCVYDTWGGGGWYEFTSNNCVSPYVRSSVSVGRIFSEDTWVHVCQKYDSNNYNMTFYIDGVENMSSILNGPIAHDQYHSNWWCIGGCNHGCWMEGYVFEPMWFDRQLSSSEISSIYSGEDNNYSLGSFTSYPVNTTENIARITNITWTEINTNLNNNITVQISVDGGVNWYNASFGSSLPYIFTENNNSLVYRVLFSSNHLRTIAISDINISWSNSPDIPGENSCGILDEAGKTYVLTQDVSSNETCFNITHPNIILDCNGHWINYTGTGLQNAYGLYTNQFNTTLKNCNIYNYTIGAYYHGASNGTIQNNTMQIYQNKNLSMDGIPGIDSTPMASGILLYNSADYNLIINTTSYSQYGRGIYLNRATNNTIINSNGSSDLNLGIQIYTNPGDLVVGYNNTILNSYAYSNSHIGLLIRYGGWNEVINSTILSNSSQWNPALLIEYSPYNKIINVTGHSFNGGGIVAISGHNALILNSRGISDSSAPGIAIDYGTRNSIVSNSTGISGITYSESCGIMISGGYSPCLNNTLVDSTGIAVGLYSSGICIGGFNNTLKNNTAIGGYGYDFRWDATDILVSDCVNTAGINYEVHSRDYVDVDVTFLNCSYDYDSIQSADSNLTRKWYYQAYVNDTLRNSLSNVNVTAYNSTGNLEFTDYTNNSGWIDRQEVTEYINRGGMRTYYGNYSIGAFLEGHPPTKNHIIDFTQTRNKIDDWFTIEEPDSTPPLITIIFPVGTIADVTPLINVSLSEEARVWYSVDGGENITLCEECDFSDDKFLYSDEGEHILRVFANDSSGNFNTTFVSFTIDMNYNYYDDFEDNSSLYLSNGITWDKGNVSFRGKFNYLDDPDLVSVYLFNDSNNLGFDLKGNNHMYDEWGNPSRSSIIPSEKKGYSIDLPLGSQVCIPRDFTFNPSEDHTMCFWTRKTQLGEDGGNVFAQGCIYDTWDNGGDAYRFTSNNCYEDPILLRDNIYVYGAYSENEWVHICQKYDSNNYNMTIYVNGAENTSKILNHPILYNSENIWCIGGCHHACFMEGQVFEPMWFNRHLSSDEIAWIYSSEGSYYSLGNFTSYPVNTTENITRITNITWTEIDTDEDNNITVQISVDGGENWYNVTSGNRLPQAFTGNNNSLVYRVIFSTSDLSNTIAISDMNISWSNLPDIPGENACGFLDEAGKTYVLTENVSSIGTCFTVTRPNITLDCNGYWINYSISGNANTPGIYTNQFNTTVKNCNIIDGNWTSDIISRQGISYHGSSNGRIENNFVNISTNDAIYLSGGSSYINITGNNPIGNNIGIFLRASLNNYIINNTAIGRNFDGIALENSNNTFIDNNTAICLSSTSCWGGIEIYGSNNTLINNFGTGNSFSGISIVSFSLDNTLINNTAISNSSYGIVIYRYPTFSPRNTTLINNTAISNSSYGIYISSSLDNTLINNTAISNSSVGVYIYNSSNNIFTNQIARTVGTSGTRCGIYIDDSNNTIFRDSTNISGGTWDVYYSTNTGSINNTFINCSYDINKEYVGTAGNELTRKWYYQAYVNDTSGNPLSGVNVSSRNSTNQLQFTQQTNNSGLIGRQEITEYVNRGGTRTYQTSHVMEASKFGYKTNITEHNITVLHNILSYITLELTSCVCPGLDLNWALNMSEYCNITVDCDLGIGNITFIEPGETRFNATISTANMQYPLAEQTLFIDSNCIVNIG